MTPLRQSMIRDQLRRKAPGTVSSYVKAVEELARHYRRSPDVISIEEVRHYLHFLIVDIQLHGLGGTRIASRASCRATARPRRER